MSDLFKFFSAANKGDFAFVDNMTDEEIKKISPFVLLGWGAGAEQNTEIHAIMTNEFMNDKVFSLGRHPRLLLKLFVAANSDIDSTRYKYIKAQKSKSTKEAEHIAAYYRCTLREAKDYARILTDDDKKEISKIYEEVK